ncbi:MAG: hypothetical protein J6X61_02530 [Clostridia bacterium]|nr:hypothetical protein [Clostridia bacterium]
MDMLFLEEFACSASFVALFTDAVGICDPVVLSVQSSKTDISLGESDMTVIVESKGEKIGLLIEDKIDAIAMPEQATRYALRGQKGVERGDYSRYYVFIVAPEKYLSQNTEAQKYPNRVTYESVLSYFETLDDLRASFKVQQLRQAIEKQKKGYQVEMDPAVTEFWNRYSIFQKANFPGVLLLYNGEIKGSKANWPRFNTVIAGLYMYHKTHFGFVDLTFEGCADRILDIEDLLTNPVGDSLCDGFTVHRTGKSAAIRLTVPILNFHKSFESQQNEVETCFEAIQKMSDTVKKFPFDRVAALLNKTTVT